MARKLSKSKGIWKRDYYEILGGEGVIYSVNASGDVWQFLIWVLDEGKPLRKFLRTREFDAAIQRAEELCF